MQLRWRRRIPNPLSTESSIISVTIFRLNQNSLKIPIHKNCFGCRSKRLQEWRLQIPYRWEEEAASRTKDIPKWDNRHLDCHLELLHHLLQWTLGAAIILRHTDQNPHHCSESSFSWCHVRDPGQMLIITIVIGPLYKRHSIQRACHKHSLGKTAIKKKRFLSGIARIT